MKKALLFFVLVTFAGCSTISGIQNNLIMGRFEYARVADLKQGISIEEAKRIVQISPVGVKAFVGPGDTKKQMTVLVFEGALQEYQDKGKHWLLFDDGKLVSQGQGDAASAELLWTFTYYDLLSEGGKLTRANAERKKYQKITQLYALNSYENEYFTYRIVIASRVDKKEIDLDMANYLLAQKKAEIDAKIETARLNFITQQQTDEMLRLQRSSLFLQSMQTLQAPRKNFDCTTTHLGSTSYTSCN